VLEVPESDSPQRFFGSSTTGSIKISSYMGIASSWFLQQEEEEMSKRPASEACEEPAKRAAVPYEQHVTTELRQYQARICNRSREGNHIIVLPTGAGKSTLLAA
jgi:superfamily II DNA or RNA helicase